MVVGFDVDVNEDGGDVVEGSEICTRPEEPRAEGICERWVNCWFGEGFWYQRVVRTTQFPAPPRPVWRYSGGGWEEVSVCARGSALLSFWASMSA